VTRKRYAAVLLGCVALMGGLVGACGDDDDGGGGGSGGGSTGTEEQSGSIEGAKVIDPASMEGAKGEVTYCTGKDTSGAQKESVKLFNQENQANGLSAKLLEFPESADEQRNQFVQRQEAASGECDIFYADVVWTAEFAQQKWLYDMTPYVESRKAEFIPATFDTVNYAGKTWGVPKQSDAGFLYYRTDQVDSAPSTWQEVYDIAAQNDGIAYQGAAYEGLTCNFLEIAFAAGGKVLSDDGTQAEFDSPENLEALQFMVDGINDGAAPKAVTTYMEEQARRAFEAGRATFQRNWPYAYAIGKENKNAPKFDVAAFPEFEGGGKAGILGGHNLVISASSENPGGALALIDYLTSEESITRDATDYSLAPVLESVYEDPAVQKALPFADQLKQAIAQAQSRPVSPVYTQISAAIYKNVNEALSGQTSHEEALKDGQSEMERALATF
jgi:multiple sugar transport system substrate-binding protein